MSKTFAIADLHGRFDLLTEAIRRVEEASQSGGTIVFTGDYIDRGPQSAEIIERLMAGPDDPTRWKWVCLKGNHEDMLVEVLGTEDEGWWIGNGGTATLASYGGVVPAEHRRWMDGLPTFYTDGKRVFVHAGVEPDFELAKQTEHNLMWMRFYDGMDISFPEGHVVHGHTPHRNGPELLTGRTNLDTLAWATGRLVVAVFDDDKDGGPASLLTIHGKPYGELELAA